MKLYDLLKSEYKGKLKEQNKLYPDICNEITSELKKCNGWDELTVGTSINLLSFTSEMSLSVSNLDKLFEN